MSLALTAAYVLAMALLPHLPAPDLRTEVEMLLLGEALFAGPMFLAGILSMLMRQVEARRAIFQFQVGYIFITLAIYYLTFTGEHDAQYQLALLFIPLVGFPWVVLVGLIAAFNR